MKKLMKIPFYISFSGILLSFVLFIISANFPNMVLLVTGLVLFFISGWIFAAKFFLAACGCFSLVLDPK